jgi:hypothetical protein
LTKQVPVSSKFTIGTGAVTAITVTAIGHTAITADPIMDTATADLTMGMGTAMATGLFGVPALAFGLASSPAHQLMTSAV